MSRVDVGGVGFHVRRLGPDPADAPTVVMLHGLSADNLSSLYYTLAPPVAAFAHVVLYDLRGHGRTDRTPGGYGLDDSVADLVGLLEALDLDRPVHLVGHSYGGAVALALALARPEAVASLVMLEGHVPHPGWGEYMAASVAFLAYSLKKPEVVEWFATEAPRKAVRARDDVEALIEDTSWVHDLEHRTTAVDREALRTLVPPVLGIYGEHSDVFDTGRELVELACHARLEVIADEDHSLLLRCADRVNALVVPFIAEQAGHLERATA